MLLEPHRRSRKQFLSVAPAHFSPPRPPMRQSTRLIVNSLATLARLGLTFVFALLTTRLLLRELEFSDFGILSVLGASGVLLMLLSQSMAGSAQRHLSYEIGRNDAERLRQVFSSALGIFTLVALFVTVAGVALGPFILNVLTIPDGREVAAWWTYHLVLVTLVVTVIGTPYKGLLIARQDLVVTSTYEILESGLRLVAVLALEVLPGDKLITWGWLMVAIRVGTTALPVATCLVRYRESWPGVRWVEKDELKRIASYAGWATLGSMANRLRSQGGLVLLNLSFNEIVSGGYSIASRLSAQQMGFSIAFQRTVQPAMVRVHARGRSAQAHTLGLLSDKYLLLAMSVALVPLWLETDVVLKLWLGEYPPHTMILVQLVMAWTTVPFFTRSYVMALRAYGEIGAYTRVLLTMVVVALVGAVIAFEGLGLGPWALPACALVAELALSVYNLVFLGRLLEIPVSDWWRRTVRPTLVVVVPCLAAAFTAGRLAPSGWPRLLTVTLVYLVLMLPMSWWLSLDDWERGLFGGFAGRLVGFVRGHRGETAVGG